jgi:hypothetical protein
MKAFLDQCEGVVNGYTLRPGKPHPETYDQLVDFIGERLDIGEDDLSVSGLSRWLMSNKTMPGSCSPETDAKHVEAVILIAELSDPDSYVACLPSPTEAVVLPPPQLVRQLIASQNQA